MDIYLKKMLDLEIMDLLSKVKKMVKQKLKLKLKDFNLRKINQILAIQK